MISLLQEVVLKNQSLFIVFTTYVLLHYTIKFIGL